MIICLEQGANDLHLHMVQLMPLAPRLCLAAPKIQIGLTLLVPA